jgi:two-component system, OmpR family, response regulator
LRLGKYRRNETTRRHILTVDSEHEFVLNARLRNRSVPAHGPHYTGLLPVPPLRILLVEDDVPLGEAVCAYLRAKAFIVDMVCSLEDARAAIAGAQYAAVLLDLHLPDGDGLSLLPYLRALRDPPVVVVLTARDQVTDRIRGLDAGADDYLIKPYDPGELLARLRAVERRRSGSAGAVLQLGALEIDLSRDLVKKDGAPVVLTQKEWALLRVMAMRPERIHTREVLQNALYGFDEEAESNTLEVFVSRLRRKLGRGHIQTLRGLGYRLAPDHGAQ